MKKYLPLLLIVSAFLVFATIEPSLAAGSPGGSVGSGVAGSASDPLSLLTKTGLGTADAKTAGDQLPVTIGKLIRSLLGLLGIIMVVLMIYAGFLWMTAAGSDEKVNKAKAIIRNAIIGILITLLAYAITGFVISSILKAAGGTT